MPTGYRNHLRVLRGARTSTEACEEVGISFRQADYWARIGFIVPSISEARGSGSRRLYSPQDILTLKVVKIMLNLGLNLAVAKEVIEKTKETLKSGMFLLAHTYSEGAAGHYMRTAASCFLTDDADKMLRFIAEGPCWVVQIPEVTATLEKASGS